MVANDPQTNGFYGYEPVEAFAVVGVMDRQINPHFIFPTQEEAHLKAIFLSEYFDHDCHVVSVFIQTSGSFF